MNKFLVILPFHPGDMALALDLLSWINEIGGAKEYPILLLASARVAPGDLHRVVECARPIFGEIYVERCLIQQDETWPRGANAMFRLACQVVFTRFKMPFLWMEPDCVPIRSGWLDLLATEYAKFGRPFMGYVRKQSTNPSLPATYLPGCSVYPANSQALLCNHIQHPHIAWDVSTAAITIPRAHSTLLMFEWWGKRDLPPLFRYAKLPGDPENVMTPDQIPKNAVLFHRCKDGALFGLLRSRDPVSVPVQVVSKVMADITVVITNFKRPQCLQSAFDSCLAVGVSNIVVSSSGASSDMDSVYNSIRKRHPAAIITARGDDVGCNETWLRGVRAAKTKWVHILHDDDILLPEFATLSDHISRHPKAGFFHWDGQRHGQCEAGIHRILDPYKTGLYSTDILWPTILSSNSYSPSPVSGLFQRGHLLDVLEECESHLASPDFEIRPRMMVGNDLLIWLRAAEKYSRFAYISSPLISYGNFTGGTSYDDWNTVKRLPSLYNLTRRYYLHGPKPSAESMSRSLVHIKTAFGKGTNAVDFASVAWEKEYRNGAWTLHELEDQSLPRLFNQGDKVPYVKDMIFRALEERPLDTIFVFTNSDIIPAAGLTRHILDAFTNCECAYSYRRDIAALRELSPEDLRLHSQCYSGLDLFAFTGAWWRQHAGQYPDMLYAADGWDYCMRLLMDTCNPARFFYLIYHLSHTPTGVRCAGRPKMVHNETVSEQFIRDFGGIVYWKSKISVDLRPR